LFFYLERGISPCSEQRGKKKREATAIGDLSKGGERMWKHSFYIREGDEKKEMARIVATSSNEKKEERVDAVRRVLAEGEKLRQALVTVDKGQGRALVGQREKEKRGGKRSRPIL